MQIRKSYKQYARSLSGFGGADFASDDSTADIHRFPHIVNMWRDWESENGASIETFPGFRRIVKETGTGTCHGLYHAKLRTSAGSGVYKEYIILHRGTGLWAFAADGTDDEDSPAISLLSGSTALKDSRSTAFSYGDAFYLMDGSDLYKIAYAGACGAAVTEDTAYVPTTYAEGKEYEQRNMLTNTTEESWANSVLAGSDTDALKVAVASAAERTLKVTGAEPGITHLYIPSGMSYNGETYKIVEVQAAAFQNNTHLQTVAIASGVKKIGGYAFAGCTKLKNVVLYGVTEINQQAFQGDHEILYFALSSDITNLGLMALEFGAGEIHNILFGGTSEEATEKGLTFETSGTTKVYYGCHMQELTVGDVLRGSATGSTAPWGRTLWPQKFTPLVFQEAGYEAENAECNYTFQAAEAGSMTVMAVHTAAKADPHMVIATVTDDEGNAVNEKESQVITMRYPLFDRVESIEKVTLDGKEITSSGAVCYRTATETVGEETLVTAVILTGDKKDIRGKKLVIRCDCVDGEFSRSAAGAGFMDDSPSYTGTAADAIKKCRVAAEFDGRIFLTGHPDLPNTVFYSNRNLAGVNDPTYFGILNYFNDGVGLVANRTLLSTPSFLAVIKEDTVGASAIYYHTGEDTEFNILPRIYPSRQGSSGIGCTGFGTVFRDDPVFISKTGLESVSLEAVNNERSLRHRSSNIDRVLTRGSALAMTEWKGYLVILLSGGRVLLADSRQFFTHATGDRQYEWYYLEGFGEWEGQKQKFFTVSAPPKVDGKNLTECFVNGVRLRVSNTEGKPSGEVKKALSVDLDAEGSQGIEVTVYYDDDYNICDTNGEKIGGTFCQATAITSADGRLFFAAENGSVFVVNTDKRGVDYTVSEDYTEPVPEDQIHRFWYTQNGRRYISGFATKKDDCGVPIYDKDTIPTSLVIKSKTMAGSRYTVKVRTDREDWEELRINTASTHAMDNTDFTNTSFRTTDEMISTGTERKYRWAEKQYYLFSDGFRRPFGIYHISYRYTISGSAGRIRRG